MSEITPINITLARGYTDADGKEHREVTIGRRLTGRDMFALDDSPLAEIATQRHSLIVSKGITKFGSLSIPVSLKTLLSLTRTDREDLIGTYNRFALESAGERQPEFLPGNKVRLAFGFNIGGILYDMAEFGNEITGYDEVDGDKLGLTGLSHACFLIGREITRLSQSDGTAVLEGRVELESFEELDAADIANLQIAAALWRDSFRAPREKVQGRDGEGGAGAGDQDRLDGRADSEAAPVTA